MAIWHIQDSTYLGFSIFAWQLVTTDIQFTLQVTRMLWDVIGWRMTSIGGPSGAVDVKFQRKMLALGIEKSILDHNTLKCTEGENKNLRASSVLIVSSLLGRLRPILLYEYMRIL